MGRADSDSYISFSEPMLASHLSFLLPIMSCAATSERSYKGLGNCFLIESADSCGRVVGFEPLQLKGSSLSSSMHFADEFIRHQMTFFHTRAV